MSAQASNTCVQLILYWYQTKIPQLDFILQFETLINRSLSIYRMCTPVLVSIQLHHLIGYVKAPDDDRQEDIILASI